MVGNGLGMSRVGMAQEREGYATGRRESRDRECGKD